jgi:hypothetical protein
MTEATDATTADPMTVAFMSPMISSSAKSTAATGVLKAAARAPAAPTGITSRMRFAESPSHWPIPEAIPAPICTEGPSRPWGRDSVTGGDEHQRAIDRLRGRTQTGDRSLSSIHELETIFERVILERVVVGELVDERRRLVDEPGQDLCLAAVRERGAAFDRVAHVRECVRQPMAAGCCADARRKRIASDHQVRDCTHVPEIGGRIGQIAQVTLGLLIVADGKGGPAGTAAS